MLKTSVHLQMLMITIQIKEDDLNNSDKDDNEGENGKEDGEADKNIWSNQTLP